MLLKSAVVGVKTTENTRQEDQKLAVTASESGDQLIGVY